MKNELPTRKIIALELLHQILGHRPTRILLAGNAANVWEYVELRIYPDPFCTSCQISSMKKKAMSKIPPNPKAPFKWVFMNIIPTTAPKSLIRDTMFSNYLLIVHAYSKIPKLYGMEISLLKRLWTNWICSSPDSGKSTNLVGGI